MNLISIYTTQTSRQERLNYLAYSIKKRRGRSLAFQSLDKKDQITFLVQCKIKESIANWNKIGKQTLKNAVQQLLHAPKLPNLLQLPPLAMTKAHITPFLTGKNLANLRSTHKTAAEFIDASLIIKNYDLAPLIARYCHQDWETLSEDGKIKALHQLMSMVQELSKLERIELPSYRSIGQFFELIEAKNLLRMAARMHGVHPLAGLKNKHLQIAKDSTSTLQRAEKVRASFGQHPADLQAFVKLNLSNYNLSFLPTEIGQLGALTNLLLHNNHLPSLPKEIDRLKNLTALRLDHNRLTSLPKEIGQLRALCMLWLDYNRLTTLPKEIGQIGALIHLVLANNRLTNLPKEISQLRALIYLGVENNRLTSLPKGIGQLEALRGLGLRNNQLTTLLKEIGELKNLRCLQAKGNGLVYLPARLERFSDQLKEQNQILQTKSVLTQLRGCLKGKHDCRVILTLLDTIEKLQGKEMRSKLHACLYEVCKKEKSLRKKLQSLQFGRKAFVDPEIDPKFKLAALKRFEKMLHRV